MLPRLHHFLDPITLWSSDISGERESSIHPQICRSLARVSVGDEVMCEREMLVQCIARWKSRSIANERTATASEDAKDEFVVVLNRSEGQVKI